MKVRDIVKLIEADGWFRVKAKGGHRQYKHAVKRGRVTIPRQMNADLDEKTEKSILRQAGLETWFAVGSFMETYLVVIGKTATGYSAHCPDVPGCAAVGKSIEKVLAHMRSALALHIEGLLEDGEPIPTPGGPKSYRKVMKDLDVNRYVLGHVQVDIKRVRALASHLG